jgi:nitrogen fixation protein FixH
MTREFTGRHMAMISVAFFTVVIGVNVVMATLAERTFSGTVVENGYVASQHFNRWLAEAAHQTKAGWSLKVESQGPRPIFELNGRESAAAIKMTAVAMHPLGLVADTPVSFEPLGHGRFQAVKPLPSGRWRMRITVRAQGQTIFFAEDVMA